MNTSSVIALRFQLYIKKNPSTVFDGPPPFNKGGFSVIAKILWDFLCILAFSKGFCSIGLF